MDVYSILPRILLFSLYSQHVPIARGYQERKNNNNFAQIIFTTHETSLLNQEILRRDQIYFVDKNSNDGASELYSLADFSIRNDTNIQKAYLLGKFGAIPSVEEVK